MIQFINCRLDALDDFLIGQEQDLKAMTGCTVIIAPDGAVCGVDVRGGSPVTRDTAALNPLCNRNKVHSVVLCGGSSYGLDAAGGVMKLLEERKIGRDVGVTVVPNVCAAMLYDLKCGSSVIRPDAEMGYSAAMKAFNREIFRSGSYGAGTGATVGTIGGIENAMKGGVGISVLRFESLIVGAAFVVNCVGDIYENGKIIAGARNPDGKGFADSEQIMLAHYDNQKDFFSENTIIGCIMTNADLTKSQASKLASFGQNGIARAVKPSHTVFDGDTVFALCSGRVKASLDAVGILASHAVEKAIADAVKSAESYDKYISYRAVISEAEY